MQQNIKNLINKKNLLLAALGLFIILLLYSLVVRNSFIRLENQIEALNLEKKNIHTAVFSDMRQKGVVLSKYGDMVNEALEKTFGAGGSKAAFQFLKNQGTIPAEVLDSMNLSITAAYNKFSSRTTTNIDVVRIYKDKTTELPTSAVASLYGYPTKPWDELYNVLVSEHTQSDFESGILTEPKLF